MKTRIITSAVGILILAAVLLFFNTVFFDIVIALMCLIAIHEIFIAFQFEKCKYIYIAFALYALVIMMSNFNIIKISLLPISYLFALCLAICVIINSQTINFAKLSGMTVFSGIVIFCFYSFIYLKNLLPKETYGSDAIYFMLLILGFAWGGDSAAYFAGRFFGKHKLAPVVSPHKTIEGAIGGVLGSIVFGLIITVVYISLGGELVSTYLDNNAILFYLVIIGFSIISSILGIMGDLLASAIKRQCGIKDYGTIFPGHGGVLDRFDSVLFIAPFILMAVILLR